MEQTQESNGQEKLRKRINDLKEQIKALSWELREAQVLYREAVYKTWQPLTYDANGPLQQKILYCLNKYRKMFTVADLVKCLVQQEVALGESGPAFSSAVRRQLEGLCNVDIVKMYKPKGFRHRHYGFKEWFVGEDVSQDYF